MHLSQLPEVDKAIVKPSAVLIDQIGTLIIHVAHYYTYS